MESCPAEDSSCCAPHVFTSVLLGALACVLMTGGVFLAFHRWDPLWLIVSGVGVILVLIGSILHCCRGASSSSSKACCLPDHHVILNGLTEQLLPLSNARSVSQLSLNMLPGYFPPMVTTYGIEQHSAVVQNINRIIQQHNTPSAGKNIILLSLPGNTTQANIQNLVATVYQLDGSVLAETSNSMEDPSVSTASSAVQSNIPVLKNAQVQTCAAWPVPNVANPTPSTSNEPISTQTENVAIHLMDCLPDPICDTQDTAGEIYCNPTVLVDISEDRTLASELEVNRTSLTNIPVSSDSIPTEEPPEVLVDITDTSSSICIPPTESAVENASEEPTDSLVDSSRLQPVTDADSIGRSSPPPSYEDVTLQEENPIGLFGLTYGTL